MFRDSAARAAFAAELRALHTQPHDAPLLWKHGLGPAMRSEALRLLEIRNCWKAKYAPARSYASERRV